MFQWLMIEEEISKNPMEGMSPPKVPEKLVPVIPTDDLSRLFKSCDGKTFVARRDLAILRTLASTGSPTVSSRSRTG